MCLCVVVITEFLELFRDSWHLLIAICLNFDIQVWLQHVYKHGSSFFLHFPFLVVEHLLSCLPGWLPPWLLLFVFAQGTYQVAGLILCGLLDAIFFHIAVLALCLVFHIDMPVVFTVTGAVVMPVDIPWVPHVPGVSDLRLELYFWKPFICDPIWTGF